MASEHALDHDRRAFELEFGIGAERVGLEAPRHFQLVEVRSIDLIERRIAREFHVGAVGRPFAVRGRRLALTRERFRLVDLLEQLAIVRDQAAEGNGSKEARAETADQRMAHRAGATRYPRLLNW